MVAGGGQLEEKSIKGLQVILSPGRAHAADVSISYDNIKNLNNVLTLELLSKTILTTGTVNWI